MTARETSLILLTDGASRGNPGHAGIGIVLQHPDGSVRACLYKYIGQTTNNVAEYTALLYGLREALLRGAQRVHVKMDSELVARQMSGRYRVREPGLQSLHAACRQLADGFEECRIESIPREANAAADRLAALGVQARPSTTLQRVHESETGTTGEQRPDRRPPARPTRWEESPGSRGQRKG